MTLNELFKNTTYDDTLFSAEDKSAVESRIFMKSVRGAEVNIPPQTGQQNGGNRSRVTVEMSPGVRL